MKSRRDCGIENKNKMEANLKENAKQMKNEMDGMNANMNKKMKEMRGEMQKMGHGLQAGIMALAYDETRTAGEKMAPPRAGTNELGGECNGCRARKGGG